MFVRTIITFTNIIFHFYLPFLRLSVHSLTYYVYSAKWKPMLSPFSNNSLGMQNQEGNHACNTITQRTEWDSCDFRISGLKDQG